MFGASTPQNIGGLKTADLFSTTSQLNGKFNGVFLCRVICIGAVTEFSKLKNSGNVDGKKNDIDNRVGISKGSPTSSQNDMNFGPETT